MLKAELLEIIANGENSGIEFKKMLAGQRYIRNQIITETLRDYKYTDMRGMGVRRKIVPLTKEFTGKDAQFEITDDYVKVIIPSLPILWSSYNQLLPPVHC